MDSTWMGRQSFEMKPKKDLLKQVHDGYTFDALHHKHVKEKDRLDVAQT